VRFTVTEFDLDGARDPPSDRAEGPLRVVSRYAEPGLQATGSRCATLHLEAFFHLSIRNRTPTRAQRPSPTGG
jgi:hypothetical protein